MELIIIVIVVWIYLLKNWLHLDIHREQDEIVQTQHCILSSSFYPSQEKKVLGAVLFIPALTTGNTGRDTEPDSTSKPKQILYRNRGSVTRQKAAEVLRYQKDTGSTKQFQPEGKPQIQMLVSSKQS